MVLEEHESQETTPPTPTSTTPRRHRIRPLDQASLSSSQERSMDVSLSFSGVPLKEGNTWSLTEGGGPPGRTYEEPSSHDTMGSMGASSSVGAFSGTDQAREGVHAALLRATGQQQRPPPGGAVGFVRAEGASSSSSGRVPSSSSSSSIDHRVGAANKGSFGPAALLRKAPRPSSKGRMGASGSAPHDETSSSTSTSVGSASHKSWGKSSSQRYSSAYGGSARFTGVSGRPSGSDQRQSTSENLIDTYRTAPSSRKASAEVPQELPYLATQQPPVSLRLLETASAMAIPPASTAGAVPSAPGSSTPATPATSSAAGRKKPAHQQPLAPAKEVPRPKNPHSRPPGAATSATPTSSAAISLGGADVRTTTTTTAAPVPHHAPSLIPICELKPPPPSPSNLALDDPNIAWLHWRPYYIHDVLGRGGFAVVFRVELCIPHGMSCSFDAFGEPKFNSAGALLLFREDPEQGEGNHTPNNGSSEGSSSSGGFGNSGGSSGELVAFNSARLIEGQLTPGGVGNLPSESDNRLGRMDEINGAGSQSLTLGAARNNDTTDGTAFRSSNGTAGYSQRASTFGGAETRFVGNARQLGLARNNDTLSFVMDGPEAEGAPAAPGREQLSLPAPKVVAGMDGASMEGRLKGTGIFYALKVGVKRGASSRVFGRGGFWGGFLGRFTKRSW